MRSSNYTDGGYKAVPAPHVKAYPEMLRGAGYYTFTDTKLDYQFSGTKAGTGPFTLWDDEGAKSHWRNRPIDRVRVFLLGGLSQGLDKFLKAWFCVFEH